MARKLFSAFFFVSMSLTVVCIVFSCFRVITLYTYSDGSEFQSEVEIRNGSFLIQPYVLAKIEGKATRLRVTDKPAFTLAGVKIARYRFPLPVRLGELHPRPPRALWDISIPLWLLLAILFSIFGTTLVIAPARRYRRGKRGCCKTCGYDLTGNVSGVCPECGCATKA